MDGAYERTKGVDLMQIDLVFRIAAVGVLVAVLNLLLTNAKRDDQAMMVVLAGLVVVMMLILREIDALFTLARTLFQL
jgi:stage III sporulation protein AC